tara:strand:- start:108 stop:2063 length:1956 start_codon:yes stop_codon:yes gene_type:complete
MLLILIFTILAIIVVGMLVLIHHKTKPLPISLIKNENEFLIDTFIVNDELDLLELRLNEHDDFTKYFIGVESNRTHKGKEKPWHVKSNMERFEKWKEKFILLSLDDSSINLDGTMRERRARDFALDKAKSLIKDYDLNDYVVSFVCDADEIYNKPDIIRACSDIKAGEFKRPQWQFFYYNLNCHNPKHTWPDRQQRTFLCLGRDLNQISHFDKHGVVPKLKSKNTGVIGWHMSNFGSEEYIREKYKSVFEANRVRVVPDVKKAIEACEDVLGRKNYGWQKGDPYAYPRTLTKKFGKSSKGKDFWKTLLLDYRKSVPPRSVKLNSVKKGKIRFAFYQNSLQERGSSIALYDYADFGEKYSLFQAPIIIYDQTHRPKTNKVVLNKFNERFGQENIFPIEDWTEVDKILSENDVTHLYIIKWGTDDKKVSNLPNVKTCVHCVFGAGQPHGDVYARISETVAAKRNRVVPVVPHIVRRRKIPGKDLRRSLGIPNEATVFGRYGGRDTFDIGYVKTQIKNIVNSTEDVYFLFANTNKFVDHPRVLYVDTIYSEEDKDMFIRTCDAMIHARRRGESFGLSIAEFSIMNKPIITSNKQYVDAFHLKELGSKGMYYHDEDSFYDTIMKFDRTKVKEKDWKCYQNYSPEKVMKTFKKVFI